jgi:hypothetical protein
MLNSMKEKTNKEAHFSPQLREMKWKRNSSTRSDHWWPAKDRYRRQLPHAAKHLNLGNHLYLSLWHLKRRANRELGLDIY